MFFKLNLVLVSLAAIGTLTYVIARTERVGPLLPAAAILLFMHGPFLALGLLAWVLRSDRAVSIVLFCVALPLICFSASVFSLDIHEYYNAPPEQPRGSNWLAFLIPAAQWLVVACLTIILMPWFAWRGRQSTGQSKVVPSINVEP